MKALRLAVGVSGGVLARNAEVSRSMLSRIERGLVNPSVDTLERIATALRVPVTLLLVDPQCRTNFSHVPSGRGIAIQGEGIAAGYSYELLGPKLFGGQTLEAYLVTVLEEAVPHLFAQKPGVKFVRLLSGEVRYRVGNKVVELQPGDTLTFDASVLHGIEAVQVRPVSFLSIAFS